MLDDTEIRYHRDRYRGPHADMMIEHAMAEAQRYVDDHASQFLSSVQQGIYRAVFLRVLQPDPGERQNLMGTIQCLMELGRRVNENRISD